MHFSSRFHKQIVKEKKTLDLDRVFKLDKNKEIILPLGTCFLDIFCTALQKKKYNILFDHKPSVIVNNHLRFIFGNFYNPLNLLDCLERIILKKWTFEKQDFIFSEEFGHFINLYHKARYKTKKLNEIISRMDEIDEYLINEIKKSTVILLSFETSEIWVDKKSNRAWYSFYGNLFNQKCYKNRAKLKVLNYSDIKDILTKIIKILNKFGKKKIILMTSPNKLWSTYQNKDIEICDTFSKSTYTAAFNDLSSKNISYFPAIEIFNNLNEKKKYRKDYLHINLKTALNVLEPYFKKIYF